MAKTIPQVDVTKLSFADKTQLVKDLRSTYTIWDRDHGIEEAMFIATGGRERHTNVYNAVADAVAAIGAGAGVRRIIAHAVRTVEGS
jgi:hypothetical protein